MEKYLNPDKPAPSPVFRWVILIFVSFAMFGNYYIYDSISPVADLLAKQLNFTDSDIGILNGIYSLPNLIMVLLGGIIIDRLGTRISTFVFATLCLIGAVMTASSASFEIMAAGRLVFGLGAESLIVAVTTIVGRWFKGRQLSFAFGLNLTIARLGTVAALNSPSWASGYYESWEGPMLLAVGAGIISVASVIIYWGMDVFATKNYRVKETPKQDKIVLKGMFSFSKSYWLIVLLCVTFYSAIFPFKTFAIKFFIDEHGATREFAGFLSSTLDISAMLLTPLFGLLADYIGRRSFLMMIGSLALVPVYLMMAYTDLSLVIPMALMGLSFSLIPAVIWPSVAIIVKEARLGTAYGLMTVVQAIGLAGLNFLIGWVNDTTAGYNTGMWIFSILGFLGLLFAILLRRNEMGPNGHGLEKGIKG